MPDVNHDTYDHTGVTGVPAAEAFDETAHDAHDHTGIPGVGGGAGTALVNLAIGPIPPFALNTAAVDYGVANRTMLTPFQTFADVTVSAAYYTVNNQAGNIDIGIYDASLNRLGSTGSTACPAAGKRSTALTGSVALTAGTLYYAAFVASSTSAKFNGFVGPTSADPGLNYYRRAESALPLPDPISITAENDLGKIIAVWFA